MSLCIHCKIWLQTQVGNWGCPRFLGVNWESWKKKSIILFHPEYQYQCKITTQTNSDEARYLSPIRSFAKIKSRLSQTRHIMPFFSCINGGWTIKDKWKSYDLIMNRFLSDLLFWIIFIVNETINGPLSFINSLVKPFLRLISTPDNLLSDKLGKINFFLQTMNIHRNHVHQYLDWFVK